VVAQRDVVQCHDLIRVRFGRMKTVIRDGRVGQARKGLSHSWAHQLRLVNDRG